MLLPLLMPASCDGAGLPLTLRFRAARDQIINTAPRVSGLPPQEAPVIPAEEHRPFFSGPCVLQQVMGKQQAAAPENELLPQ